ncbi:MAG TPA: amidohydrolase family protein [Candidatus Binataceae bacterium]|nr:amidohydrolase family protein [Candidatus Binataceae bacterium]
MAEFDLVIKNGMIIDGTLAPRFRDDIAIKAGRIAKIGRIAPHQGSKVIEADGLIVAPGFIDLHTHYDAQIFWDPYLTLSGWHGITSVAIGNCGFGFAPVHPKDRERSMLTMVRTEAIPLASMKAAMEPKWDWESYPQFMDTLDRLPKGVNLLPTLPMNPVLGYVMGIEESKTGRMPTDREHAEMRRILNEAMDAGACGWSAQRMVPNGPSSVQRDYDGSPMNTDVMHDETCIEMARVLGERGEGHQELTLVSWDPKQDARHFELLAEISRRPIMYQAVATQDRFPHRHRNMLNWLERCREKGLRVYGQGVTTDAGLSFTFEDWNLFDDSDAWRDATTGTIRERREKLGDPRRRDALKNQMPRESLVTSYFDQIVITDCIKAENKHLEGLTLRKAAVETGKHPVDVMLDLAVSEDLRTEFFAPAINRNMELMKELIDCPHIPFGVSDGGAHTKFLTAGRYPTEGIVKYSRENQWLTLEQIHWRLSALPAFCGGFKDRGFLREGAPADIVIYDFEKLNVMPVEIAHDLPGNEWRRVQRAQGYEWIIVNGEPTFEGDRPTGATPGQLLRHGLGA